MTELSRAIAERQRLAARQGALLDALLDGGPPPPGVDPERLQVQADALVAKHAYYAARKQAVTRSRRWWSSQSWPSR